MPKSSKVSAARSFPANYVAYITQQTRRELSVSNHFSSMSKILREIRGFFEGSVPSPPPPEIGLSESPDRETTFQGSTR